MLGAGHVATHLAPALVAAGHRVVAVWSRSAASASALLARLPPGTQPLKAPAEAAALHPDVVLVCVPDGAVAEVVAAAQLPATVLVAHTAGALPLPAHPRAGVLYPVQTFSAGRALSLADVPFCLEATPGDAAAADTLTALATSLSARPPVWFSAPERATLHLAAVFGANFTNHLLGVSGLILEGIGPGLLAALLGPLVHEVVEKALTAPGGPFSVQTGPAVRHDLPTLARHREALAANPQLAPWLPIYEALTASINYELRITN